MASPMGIFLFGVVYHQSFLYLLDGAFNVLIFATRIGASETLFTLKYTRTLVLAYLKSSRNVVESNK